MGAGFRTSSGGGRHGLALPHPAVRMAAATKGSGDGYSLPVSFKVRAFEAEGAGGTRQRRRGGGGGGEALMEYGGVVLGGHIYNCDVFHHRSGFTPHQFLLGSFCT